MNGANRMPTRSTVPPVLPRAERLAILASLALVIGLAWLYLAVFGMTMTMSDSGSMAKTSHASAASSAPMDDMPGMKMADAATEASHGMVMASLSFGFLAAMWLVMMIGMMLPSASPMILIVARIGRARTPGGGPAVGTGAFALGYLLAWTGFSLVAAAAQVGLQEGVVSGHDMAIRSAPIAGGVLIAAGLYQWTPLKSICLAKCRSPVGFLFSHWRPGALGAMRMGLSHGLFCLGCCWLLMALLFVAGVMALPWVAALAALVLLEKLAPKGEWVARAGGVAMLGAGIYLVAAG